MNLVQNALDAMEHQKQLRIDIHCWQEENQVKVEVHDYGTGITDEDLLRIFDPFFTTKDVGKGTGLGLYVSYGLIVEQCGGEMEAKNHAEVGAVFRIDLPMGAPLSMDVEDV